jgi:hypothetical protein
MQRQRQRPRAKCGGFSTARRTVRLSDAPVEMTTFGEEGGGRGGTSRCKCRSFDCVVRKSANDFAQDDRVGGKCE